jgi:hypothetical protein
MMERHRLAALILQDRRGGEIADAELRKVRHLCATLTSAPRTR